MSAEENTFTGKVVIDLAMSLDGFIGGPPNQPERLHDWMFPPSGQVDDRNAAVIEESIQTCGAILMGRGAYDLGDAYDGFVDTPYQVPHFVITHQPPTKPAKGNTQLIFVTDGIASALEQAKVAAGARNVAIGGGAKIARQYLQAGLVDEIEIHLVPVLFGSGTRLFEFLNTQPVELEITRVITTPEVTHLTYQVRSN